MFVSSRSLRNGSAMPLAVLVIVIACVIGVGLLGMGSGKRLISVRVNTRLLARAAADAGIEKALYGMNEMLKVKPWDSSLLPSVTDEDLPHSGAAYDYQVTGTIGSGYSIQSTGARNSAVKTVTCDLELKGIFDYALLTKYGMVLANGSTVDWINFGADDDLLKIGTQDTTAGALELKNDSVINGDVVCGAGGDPSIVVKDQGADITGDIYSTPMEQELPSVSVPTWLAAPPAQDDIKNSDTLYASDSGKYEAITLKNSEVLTISGDVTLYIAGDITLGNGAGIEINPNSSLTLYIGGDLEGKNSSGFNNLTKDSTKLKMYALDTCEDIEFKNNSDFYGALYAPDADIILHNTSDMHGSIIGETYDQKNSGTFYYDAALREVSMDDEAVRFVIRNWSES